jgi:hypothetical protein
MARRGFTRNEGQSVQNVAENVLSQAGTVFTTRPGAKMMSGSRTVLKVNGNLIGFAFAVSWSVSTEGTEIYTIDDPVAYEIAPKRISVTGTLGLFQIPGRSAQAELMQSDMASFLANKYITIEVKDSATDQLLFLTNRAMITGQSADLRAEQLGTMQLTWKAVGWQAEASPQPPKGIDKKASEANSTNPLDQIKQKFI